MKRNTGFTLIEIMLAVAILAIIAAIAIPAYEGYISEARIGTAIKDIRQMELVLNDLAMDSDLAAADGDVTATELGVYLVAGQITLAATGSPPAGGQAWNDPWDRIYLYRRPGALQDAGGAISNDSTLPQGYDLFSQGPDATDVNDNIVRGCNGGFLGMASDQPTC